MKQKYNIALLPQHSGQSAIDIANQFSSISDSYLLGENSLPHVTLYQFFSNPMQLQEIIRLIQSSDISRSIDLVFDHFSYITFDETIFWASLMPDRVDELNQLHRQVANLISHPIKENFDPHMTLINTRNKNYVSQFEQAEKVYTPIRDTFILSVGLSDNVGQLLRVIYQFDYEIKMTFSPSFT